MWEVEVRLSADVESTAEGAAMATVASPVKTPPMEPHPGQGLVASANSDLHLRQVSITFPLYYLSLLVFGFAAFETDSKKRGEDGSSTCVNYIVDILSVWRLSLDIGRWLQEQRARRDLPQRQDSTDRVRTCQKVFAHPSGSRSRDSAGRNELNRIQVPQSWGQPAKVVRSCYGELPHNVRLDRRKCA